MNNYYASLLVRHGESVKAEEFRLGHASAAETLDTYSRLWPDSEDRTREAVDAVLLDVLFAVFAVSRPRVSILCQPSHRLGPTLTLDAYSLARSSTMAGTSGFNSRQSRTGRLGLRASAAIARPG